MLLASVMSAITKRAMCANSGHRFREITAGRLLEIEQDRDVVALPEFLADRFENGFTLVGEASEDQHRFLADGVDHVAQLFIVEQ